MTTTAIADEQKKTLFENINNSLTRTSGRGSADSSFQYILSGHDRFKAGIVPLNKDQVGLTFFTKPKLNMSTTSLRQDRHLSLMDTTDPTSLMFALRCNLDTKFARDSVGRKGALSSPWFNSKSPFNIPMGNLVSGITGWPDFSVETESTEAGYFSEDMTFVRGSDRGRRTYDLSCTFRDIQSGFLASYFYYWIHAMALQLEGAIVAYPEDREANRLNYTCSIYRFVLDPHQRIVTKWAKATGCYPVNIPIGSFFDFNTGDVTVSAANEFTIPFKANHIAYMDPSIFQAFNTLVTRYTKINPAKLSGNQVKIPPNIENNFIGSPFVDMYTGTNELMFIADKSFLEDPYTKAIESSVASIASDTDSYLKSKFTDPDFKNKTP